MSVKVTYTAFFEKEANRLAKKYPSLAKDVLALIETLKTNPELGIPLGKGLYKIRIAIRSKGKGKSGGARVITYILMNNETVYLTAIYDKSEQDSISTAVLLKLLKLEGIVS
ncbi:MAG: hypothetical protein K0Q79_94 [Flavipsychrobacter sp.]|jgi:mRNA-degrading endonuclease RelE of RelBE toxin-antitoxin system|nr:hypothetical protein [Flavipsychrobacter sp.]